MASKVKEVSKEQARVLEEKFSDKVNLSEAERGLYDHDVGTLPGLISSLMGKAVPAAIVKVTSEEEVSWLMKWSTENKVPLVPRAWATSGYGGVIPVNGGVVVDVTLLDTVEKIDPENMTATVGAGTVWEDAVYHLAAHGLAPRLLPSSAPASSVGGWLAQGGTGYGGFQYGWFQDNVVSARVVRPGGEAEEIAGEALEAFSGSMGALGIITSVTFKVRPLVEEDILGGTFSSPETLQQALSALASSELPIWSVSFINPEGADLKNRAPERTHHGHPVSEKVILPEEYIMMVAFEGGNGTRGELEKLVSDAGGRVLEQGLADHEWEERYRPLKIKRIGPSIIPAEVVLPLEKVGEFFSGLPEALGLPFLTEGIVVSGREVIILGFIPHDERTFRYNIAYSLSLSIVNRARRLGGRAYAAGLYLATLAEETYGSEKWDNFLAEKKKLDPEELLNPAKLGGSPFFRTLMGTALKTEGLIRPLASRSGVPLGERFKDKRNIPGDTVWYTYACAQCGYCVKECDQYYGRGWESQSPRGKWSWLKKHIEGKEKMTPEQVSTFLVCTTCELCNLRCQVDLPIEPAWMQLRGELVQNRGLLTIPPFEIMAASLRKEGNIWSGYRKDRTNWVPEELKGAFSETADLAYFAGCTAAYTEEDIAQATAHLLKKAGYEFQYLGEKENCCGIPMLVAGLWDDWANNLKENVANMKAQGIKKIVTSCPACWLSWKTLYPDWAEKLGIEADFEVVHYSELLTEAIQSGDLTFDAAECEHLPRKVTWHDSCHIGRAGGFYDPPRELIKSIPGVELVELRHNRENAHCCGSVLTLIGEPEVAHDIGDMRLQEAVDKEVSDILSLCPCCEFQLRVSADRMDSGVKVHDLAHFTACALGIKTVDPTPHVMTAWAVFEKMIDLLNPQSMAEFMASLFPEMFEAMPGPMVGMMKVSKRVPGMLWVMGKVMPKMMPMMMPMIMPKVMPDMLKKVEERIPMPDHMKEQMPVLMPEAMGNLMPKMMPQVAPLVTPYMIDYIREKL